MNKLVLIILGVIAAGLVATLGFAAAPGEHEVTKCDTATATAPSTTSPRFTGTATSATCGVALLHVSSPEAMT